VTLDPTYRIQSDTGTVTGTTGFTASLPNPTTDSSTLLLFVACSGGGSLAPQQQSFDPPFFQDEGHGGLDFAWRRDSQPAGETSWAITPTSGISTNWAWRVEEWGGLSLIGQPDANTALVIVANPPSVSTGTATADVDDFAALAMFRSSWSNTGNAWPSGRAYSSGWSEVAYLTNGTGGSANDFQLIVAEAYPGASGSVQCTLTWDTSGGGTIPVGTDAWVACYQAGVPDPSTGVLTS
jgi:hypothetical protein